MANNENMRKWVAALRSGEYKQGRRFLNCNGRQCCLGVACEEAIKYGVPLERTIFNSGVVSYGPNGYTDALPPQVIRWLGIKYNDPLLTTHDNLSIVASTMNDEWERDFNYIADAIERTFLDDEDN